MANDNDNDAKTKLNIDNDYIQAINLNKNYGLKSLVLNSLNINIPKGDIYALLGESGCGKTTLLKCLIGILPIDFGNVVIFGDKTDHNFSSYRINLRELGFMPQDPCLYNELTISESFYYFAKLHCVDNSDIKIRKEFLMNLLELPDQNRKVKNLSTGQIKRVSFGCSLIHYPKVLMLDEPTVGLDPILRRKIWDYLIKISKETTIIITTHYIDEARHANTVGFMRYGKIIEESNPKTLLTKYKENVLEDVFYKICKEDDESKQNLFSNMSILEEEKKGNSCIFSKRNTLTNYVSKKIEPLTSKKNMESNFKNFFSISCKRINALLYKDMKKCQRNKSLLIVQLLVPLIQISLFCLCIGKIPSNLNIGIVNYDSNAPINLGNLFIDSLDENILHKTIFEDFNQAFLKLKSGEIWSLIKIDQNFTTDVIRSLNKTFFQHIYKDKIHIYTDNTNHQISYTIQETILLALKKIIEDYSFLFMNHDSDDFNSSTLSYPLIFEDPVYGVKKSVFTHFMAPGIAMTVVFFLSVAATASNFVLERRLGMLERSYLCGIRTVELLTSQILIYSIMLIVQIIIVLMLLFLVFDLPLRGSLVLLVILIFLQGFSGLSYGLMISSLCSTEESVLQLTLASFYPILLMSGIIWPIEAQPLALAQVSKFLPLTFATDAFRCILEKGWNLFMFKVTLGFISTFIWTLIFLFGFLLIFSLKRN